MKKLFFLVMVILDNLINHPLWDLIGIFRPGDETWYDGIGFRFCQWANLGLDSTRDHDNEAKTD